MGFDPEECGGFRGGPGSESRDEGVGGVSLDGVLLSVVAGVVTIAVAAVNRGAVTGAALAVEWSSLRTDSASAVDCTMLPMLTGTLLEAEERTPTYSYSFTYIY